MKQKSIKKNIMMNFILTSSNFFFPVVTFSYVSRVLGPSGTGRVAFVSSVLSYFSYIAILGVPAYGLREVAKYRDDNQQMSTLIQELLIINLIATIVSYILLFLSVISIPRLFEERWLFIVMGSSIFLNSIGLEWVYQALEEYSYITIRSVVFKIIALLLTFTLIRTKNDVLWYGFLHIFTSSASYLLNFLHIKKFVSLKKTTVLRLRPHMKAIFTLFASSIIITIYTNFDVTMIGFISTERQVGLYNAALKIKSLVISLSTAITTVLIPRISYYMKNCGEDKVGQLLQKSLRISLCLAVPVAVFIFIFCSEFIYLFCGDDFLGAIPTLRVLIICVIPLILTNLFGNQVLIPSGNEKRYSQSVFVGMIINLFLNGLMIPKFGSLGAAVATFITECWNVLWMSGGVKKYRTMLMHKVNVCTYLIPLLVAIMVGIIISYMNISVVFFKLVIAGILFFGVYYTMLFIKKEPLITEGVQDIIKKMKEKKA